eukprot:gene9137-33789_t
MDAADEQLQNSSSVLSDAGSIIEEVEVSAAPNVRLPRWGGGAAGAGAGAGAGPDTSSSNAFAATTTPPTRQKSPLSNGSALPRSIARIPFPAAKVMKKGKDRVIDNSVTFSGSLLVGSSSNEDQSNSQVKAGVGAGKERDAEPPA